MTACPSPSLQRSCGVARLSFCRADGQSRLVRMHQSGSAKAFVHPHTAGPEVVFLNTSGGMTGGDTLSYALDLGERCRVTATTQTAERAYRSAAGLAQVEICHRLGSGAHLDWLPQETILFDHAALIRRTTVALSGTASCLLLEAVVLGRTAMGETLTEIDFHDLRTVSRDGVPVVFEPLRLTFAALTAGLGVLQGARAFASLAMVGQGAEAALGPVRRVLNEPGVNAGASGFDGRLMIRLMALDGWPLRRQILRLLAILRDGPPPRVWQI